MSKCPKNWLILSLSEIVQTQKGKKPVGLGLYAADRVVPYINIAAFETKCITEYAPEQDVPRCNPSDTLLVWDGARAGLAGRGVSGYIGSTLAKLTSDLATPDYLFYFINSKYDELNSKTKGVGIPHINPVVLKALEFPLPPTTEQTRIVEKLEELLSDLDAGLAELKAAQKKLVQCRQSLLKAAVEGALSIEWRTTNKSKDSGAQLLERILKERRARWEARLLAKYHEQGKTPPQGWQDKYPEPVKPDTSEFSELPEGWVWASLDQLTEFITSGSRGWANYYSSEGAIFIRSQNINKDWLDLSDIAFVNLPRKSEGERTRVEIDDLLLTITGANVGKAARVEMQIEEAYVSQHVALIRPIDTALSNYFHLFLIASAGGRGQLDKVTYGAGKPGLNLQQVRSLVVPLPSHKESVILMNNLTNQFNAVVEQEKSITYALKQSATQRKNILKAAFSGQLVPQDPHDEPASVLLERIRAERVLREKQPKTKKSQKSKGMKKSNLDSLRDWIASQPGEATFNFAKLQSGLPGDYEGLKDSLFQLLAEDKPIIEQIFDREAGSLQFRRVNS